MNKAISLIIALCLIFCSVVPSFAATDVVVTAFYNGSTNSGINAGQLMQSLLNSIVSINSKLPSVTSTGTVFENIDSRLAHLEDWFVPSGSRPNNYATLMDSLIVLSTYVMDNLPYIPTISTFINSWMNTNNNHLFNLEYALTNKFNNLTNGLDASSYKANAHRNMLNLDVNSSRYTFPLVNSDGTLSTGSAYWTYGTPLGNLFLMLQAIEYNIANAYSNRWVADLKHYNDQLTTWDSQGNTLTQVAFSPESAIQGLYRYLAFTQRDVARLTYVFASDQEITAREKAQNNQTAVLNNFIDPNGSGSVSVSDLNQMRNTSSDAKNNLDGGVGVSLIWNSFNSNIYTGNDGWFTVTTANNLGYYPQTRELSKSLNDDNLDYATPMLDAYYNEIYKLFGDEK